MLCHFTKVTVLTLMREQLHPRSCRTNHRLSKQTSSSLLLCDIVWCSFCINKLICVLIPPHALSLSVSPSMFYASVGSRPVTSPLNDAKVRNMSFLFPLSFSIIYVCIYFNYSIVIVCGVFLYCASRLNVLFRRR